MANAVSTCPTCGPVDIHMDLVTVWMTPTIRYVVTCPKCTGRIERALDIKALEVLRVAGAHIMRTPAEALEAHDGAPISWDDVLDFALDLERVNPRLVARVAELEVAA